MTRQGPSIIHLTDTIQYNTIQYIDLERLQYSQQQWNSLTILTCAGEGAQSRNDTARFSTGPSPPLSFYSTVHLKLHRHKMEKGRVTLLLVRHGVSAKLPSHAHPSRAAHLVLLRCRQDTTTQTSQLGLRDAISVAMKNWIHHSVRLDIAKQRKRRKR